MDISELVTINHEFLYFVLLAILIVKALIPFFPLPKETVMIFSGLQFGLFLGALLNILGLFLGALIDYEISLSGRYAIDRRSSRLKKYQARIIKYGWRALIPLRFSPITAQDVTSYASGLAKLQRSRYYLISLLSFIIYGSFFAWVGSSQL